MCSANVVSRDKATPTHSITNKPEKCLIPICSVWKYKKQDVIRGVQEVERLKRGINPAL